MRSYRSTATLGATLGLLGVIVAVVAVIVAAVLRQHVRDINVSVFATATAAATASPASQAVVLRLASLQEGKQAQPNDALVTEMTPFVERMVINCPGTVPELVSSVSGVHKVAARYQAAPDYLSIVTGLSAILPSPATSADCFGIFRTYSDFNTALPPPVFSGSIPPSATVLESQIHAARSVLVGVDTTLFGGLEGLVAGQTQAVTAEWPSAQNLVRVAGQELTTVPGAPTGLNTMSANLKRGVSEYASGLDLLVQVTGPNQDKQLQHALALLWGANADVRRALVGAGG